MLLRLGRYPMSRYPGALNGNRKSLTGSFPYSKQALGIDSSGRGFLFPRGRHPGPFYMTYL